MNKSFNIVLVLISLMALLIVNIQPVKGLSLGPVFIIADGSVAGTNNIRRNGAIYILTGNISGSIWVQRSNIVIDGAGYFVQGNGTGTGIDLSNGSGGDPSRDRINNVTIRNIRIVGFQTDIHSYNSNNNTFTGIHALSGFVLSGSLSNTIKYNTIENWGISIHYCPSSSVITENNFIKCGVIVWLSAEPKLDRNYWSNYSAKYPNAKEVGNTGIWDTPYDYGESLGPFYDNHPLMNPVAIPLDQIPEFPSLIILPLLMITILFAAAVYRKKTPV